METRTATVTLTAGALTQTVAVTQAARPTPAYAASTHTWTFGSSALVWSDAIQLPACNKEDFDGGTDDAPRADGRSYTVDGKTYYYYSWPYVVANAATLCPNPWRVPAKADFDALVASTSGSTLGAAWGYGGLANGSSVSGVNSQARYWSSEENSSGSNEAYFLYYYSADLYVSANNKRYGFRVRCVK
jgi:hypothetical protein